MFVLAVSCRYKPDGKSDGSNGNIDISTGHCLNWFADLDGDPKNGCEYRCPVSPPALREVCGNLVDDNCDGRTDEGCECNPADTTRVQCGNNTGACRASMACGLDGRFGACVVEIGPSDTDVANCGACGNHCFFANGAATCQAGHCQLGTCAPGFANLDADPLNGCEYKCPVSPPATTEICGNLIDDNCDGRTDEGCECNPADATRVQCGNNTGACRASMACGLDGRFGACVVEIGS